MALLLLLGPGRRDKLPKPDGTNNGGEDDVSCCWTTVLMPLPPPRLRTAPPMIAGGAPGTGSASDSTRERAGSGAGSSAPSGIHPAELCSRLRSALVTGEWACGGGTTRPPHVGHLKPAGAVSTG